jgi:hypothetical protein
MRALLIAALVGCGPGSALEIVVELPPQNAGIDRVQLYLGLGSALNSNVERLVPRDYVSPPVPDGFYWRRDPNGGSDFVAVAPDASDVRFVFQEGTNDQVTAIVVGLRGDQIVAAASLVDAYLDTGSVRQYHVALKPASAAFPQPAPSPVTVQRWGAKPGDTHCVYLEEPGASDPSIFIVDENDRDCDGLRDDDPLECRPDVFMGKERAKRSEASCVGAESIPAPANMMSCVLGGAGCADGRGESDAAACDPTATCIQPSVCVNCATKPDPLACMAGLSQAALETTRITCRFSIDIITNTFCPGPATLVQRLAFLPNCSVDAPYLFWEPGQAKWANQSFKRANLMFTASKPTVACDFKLEVSGAAATATLAPIRTILSVGFGNGRAAAVPLQVDFPDATDCTDPGQKNECVIDGDNVAAPSFLACLGARVVEPW